MSMLSKCLGFLNVYPFYASLKFLARQNVIVDKCVDSFPIKRKHTYCQTQSPAICYISETCFNREWKHDD